MRIGRLWLLLGLWGCHASTRATAQTEFNQAGGEWDEPPSVPVSTRPSDNPTPPASSARNESEAESNLTTTSFLGVTHDLSLTVEAATKPVCECLAATVGGPQNPAFQWAGAVPLVGQDALVLGIGKPSKGCAQGAKGRGPSIQGVEIRDNNVVVTLEDVRAGTPLAQGAIIPNLGSNGVLIFRTSRRLRYAKALPGSTDSICRIEIGPS